MEQVVATNSELLATRRQVSLAEQGRELLKEKRMALLREFRLQGADVLAALEQLERRAGQAREALAESVALDGPEGVGSAAVAAGRTLAVEVSARTVAGVRVVGVDAPDVVRPAGGRGYALITSSPRVDRVAELFEHEIQQLLDVVGRELTLRRLADEIRRTTRQVNALEHVVVPRLTNRRDRIAQVLEERELESRVRLMRARDHRKTGVR